MLVSPSLLFYFSVVTENVFPSEDAITVPASFVMYTFP